MAKLLFINKVILIPLRLPGECMEFGTIELFGVDPPGGFPKQL